MVDTLAWRIRMKSQERIIEKGLAVFDGKAAMVFEPAGDIIRLDE